MNKSLAVAVVALVVAVVGVMFPRSVERVVETVTLGAASGTDHSNFERFVGGLSDGGTVVATSTGTNSTLLASTLMSAKAIDHTLNGGSGTLTLPASSTLAGWLPEAGETREVLIRNATTSASVVLTVAAGTGMTFKNGASSSVAIQGDTDGKNTLKLIFYRTTKGGNFTVFTDRFQD